MEPRFVTLLLDTSDSMRTTETGGVPAITALNRQLATWLPAVRAEGSGALRGVEFAVVTYGMGGVLVVSGDGTPSAAFVPAARLEIPELTAGGATPMVAAIDLALHLLEDRRALVAGPSSSRIILVGDGAPTDFEGNPSDGWRPLAQRLARAREDRRTQIFAFGLPGADDTVMRALATDDGYFELPGLDMARLLSAVLVAGAESDFSEVRRFLSTAT
ncbi:VWA domain-containing protein [Actinoplanes sp. NPDC049802]|uniref:vWA domain-containing protein n=1 Tax=Actinoplanes sp. NPDC049802 TaxID=3154742 RepID=UPI0033CAA662